MVAYKYFRVFFLKELEVFERTLRYERKKLKMGEYSTALHVYLLIAIFELNLNHPLQQGSKRRKMACVFSSSF